MASIQNFLDKISAARFGKDVRSSIVNAIDAVNKESETSVKKVNQAEANINKAVVDATNATNAANTAASSAITAANNANEAAQAIFDEKYILTARTEFNRSASVSPTAKGNAILEKMRGDSWQKQLSGKNLYNANELQNVNNYKGVVDSDGWITIEYDNTAGTSSAYINHYTKPSTLLLPNTPYTIVCEVKELSKGTLNVFNNDSNGGQFTEIYSVSSTGTHIKTAMTKETFTGALSMLRTFFYVGPGQTCKAVFRISVLKDLGVTQDTFVYEPYCGGTASPNPSYPQGIRSVGDCGWFDGVFVKAYLNTANGSSIVTSDAITSVNAIPCKPQDSIKIEYKGNLTVSTIHGFRVCFYDTDNNFVSGGNYNSANGIKVPNGAASFKFDMTFNSTTFKLSDVGHAFVTINDKYALIVDEVGKNICGGEALGTAFVNAFGCTKVDGTKILQYTGVTTTNKNTNGHIAFKENTQYTFIFRLDTVGGSNNSINSNLCVVYTDGTNSGHIGNAYRQGDYTIFTTPADKSVKCIAGWQTSGTVTLYCEESGIFEGVVSLEDFVPHQSSRHYIPLDEPLRSIGDVGDEIKCVDGLYGALRMIGRDVLGNGRVWHRTTSYKNPFFYSDIPDKKKGSRIGLCSDFFNANLSQTDAPGFGNNAKDKTFGFPNNTLQIFVRNDSHTDVADFTNAVKGTIIHYELAEPVFEPFEDQTPFYNLEAYDEVTHVSIAGCHEELNPIVTMRFPRNEDGAMVTTNWCDNKKTEIRMNELTAALLALGRE